MKILTTFIFLFAEVCWADNIFEAAGKDLTSPMRSEAKNYLSLGLSTSAFMYVFFKDDFILGIQEESVENKPLGDYALYGDYGGQLIPNALYAGGMYASYMWSDDKEYKRFASQMFRASLYSGLITTVLKNAISEKRPNGVGQQSFPSGHTTTAFAFASVVAMNHEWYWGVPAYLFATFVGYSRINDNKHYLHDVTVGATIGIVYGMGIYYTDVADDAEKTDGKTASLFVSPTLLPGGLGFQMIKTF